MCFPALVHYYVVPFYVIMNDIFLVDFLHLHTEVDGHVQEFLVGPLLFYEVPQSLRTLEGYQLGRRIQTQA